MPILKPPRKNEKFKSFGIVCKITFSQGLHIWRKLILSGKQLPVGKKKGFSLYILNWAIN
jgi:hypothetical protein